MPRTITDAHVEEVVVRTLEEVPEGATHWSKRELAKRVGISPTSVHRIWRAFGLQPWRTEDFKISPDPLLIDKIRDVIGLYLAPPTNAAVFAVDEKPPGSRSPPCAHHDPLCAMQTREWTSTRTIQNNWAGIRASGRPTAIAERDDHGVGARAGSDARSIAESERVLPCYLDRSADARSDGHVLGPGGLATGSGWPRRKPASALSSRLP